MAAPVLVKAYNTTVANIAGSRLSQPTQTRTLPSASSFVFADILREADCPDFQAAIDGIAEICAKNRMSLADEYSSHLPPLGEITAATSSSATTRHISRPGMRRLLTSVPEGSSGSSDGSQTSKRSRRGCATGRERGDDGLTFRKIRVGSVGRTVSTGGIVSLDASDARTLCTKDYTGRLGQVRVSQGSGRTTSEAVASLQRLLKATTARGRHVLPTDARDPG